MYRLNAYKNEGSETVTTFEQVFHNYVAMKEKESELNKRGMMTVVTVMTEEEHKNYSSKLLEKFIGLSEKDMLN